MEKLWEIANNFRSKVCSELRALTPDERLALRGDYLFIIDSKPCFIVMVDSQGAWSVTLSYRQSLVHPLYPRMGEAQITFAVESGCPLPVTLESVQNCIDYSARTTITTDSQTLEKLLLGKLKAKVAFLTSKVVLAGDLAAFLKMVSILKSHGVGPVLTSSQGVNPHLV